MKAKQGGHSPDRVQITLAGIGGQGILFSARVFSEWGLEMGLGVMGSETHGMSQRGGSVMAHLKLGDFLSPMIRVGQADFLYAFDKNECYRTLRFLREGGYCFANLGSEDRLDPVILSHIEGKNIRFRACDASGLASQIGWVRSANIILMGFSVGTGLVPFAHDDLRRVVEVTSRKKQRGVNLDAFDSGFKEGRQQLE